MVKIIFDGWKPGMRKIPFIKLLNEGLGMSLTESKEIKDRLVDKNEKIELIIDDKDLGEKILDEATKLNVIGKLEIINDENN